MAWVTKASPISEPGPGMTLSTPSGRPASSKIRASRMPPVTGVSLAGFSTTALPTAMAGAIERLDSWKGKFHGLMTPTTPTGILSTRLSLPGASQRGEEPSTM